MRSRIIHYVVCSNNAHESHTYCQQLTHGINTVNEQWHIHAWFRLGQSLIHKWSTQINHCLCVYVFKANSGC